MRVNFDDNNLEQTRKNLFFAGTTTIDNVQAIRRVIQESIHDGITRHTAEDILSYIPEKNWKEEIAALFSYVEGNMRYTLDMSNVEMIKTPARHISDINTRGRAFGDCDDHVILLGSLLYNVGYDNLRLVIMRSIGNTSGGYNHIYIQVLPMGSVDWVSLDATEKAMPMGWEPGSIDRRYFNV